MAIYHLTVKHGNVQNGLGKAPKHCDYINGLGEYSYKQKEIVYQNSFMPDWVSSPSEFFKLSEENESINGVTYKELEITLPSELSVEDNIKLLNKFIDKELEGKYYFSVAIHDKESSKEGIQNIHAHVMFCTRELDGIERDKNQFFKRANTRNPSRGGAKKNIKWDSRNVKALKALRKSWEDELNVELEKRNIEKVSSETLAMQRQEALLKGDYEKAEKLNRDPINVAGYILIKKQQGISLNEREEKEYQNYKKYIKERDILDEIYKLNLEKEKLIKERERLSDINKSFNELNDKKYFSNVNLNDNSKFKSMVELELELMKEQIHLQNINSSLNENNLEKNATYFLSSYYKNLIQEQEYYLDKIYSSKISSKEKLSFYLSKLNECEEKLSNIKLNKVDIEIEINKLKEDLIKEKEISEEKLKELERQKVYFYSTLNSKENAKFDEVILENRFYSTATFYIDNSIKLQKINSEIDKIDKQLDKEKLQDTAINIFTKGEYRKTVNELKKLNAKLEIINNKLSSNATDDLDKKLKEKEKLEEKINKLNQKKLDIESKISTPASKNKIKRISESIKKKLEAKKYDLLNESNSLKEHLKFEKVQMIDTVKNRELLTKLKEEYNNNLKQAELKIEKLEIALSKLKFDQAKLERYAYNKLTGGRYLKLLDDYNKKSEALNKAKEELKELGIFKIKEKRILSEKIKELEKECEGLKEEYKNIISSISKQELEAKIEELDQHYNNSQNIIKEQLQEAKEEKFEQINRLKILKEVQEELYPYSQEQYQEKLKNININDNKEEAGSSSRVIKLDIDDEEKSKKKKKELDLFL